MLMTTSLNIQVYLHRFFERRMCDSEKYVVAPLLTLPSAHTFLW